MSETQTKKKKRTGTQWRVAAEGRGNRFQAEGHGDTVFDELVIDDFLHVEQLGDRQWWVSIGTSGPNDMPTHLTVSIGRDGKARVIITQVGDRLNASQARALCEVGS